MRGRQAAGGWEHRTGVTGVNSSGQGMSGAQVASSCLGHGKVHFLLICCG